MKVLSGARPDGPVAPELPSHGYVITKPVRGSDIPMDLTFVLMRDEIYAPIAVRKPEGDGPFPVITMGRGDGRAGMPHVGKQVDRLAPMQDRMIERGYVVAYPFIYRQDDGSYKPDPIQQQAFDVFMDFFDKHLKHRGTS